MSEAQKKPITAEEKLAMKPFLATAWVAQRFSVSDVLAAGIRSEVPEILQRRTVKAIGDLLLNDANVRETCAKAFNAYDAMQDVASASTIATIMTHFAQEFLKEINERTFPERGEKIFMEALPKHFLRVAAVAKPQDFFKEKAEEILTKRLSKTGSAAKAAPPTLEAAFPAALDAAAKRMGKDRSGTIQEIIKAFKLPTAAKSSESQEGLPRVDGVMKIKPAPKLRPKAAFFDFKKEVFGAMGLNDTSFRPTGPDDEVRELWWAEMDKKLKDAQLRVLLETALRDDGWRIRQVTANDVLFEKIPKK